MEQIVSGVGVLDKSMAILDAVTAAGSAGRALTEIVDATAIPKPTAHRLSSALVAHGLLRRRDDGRFVLGARCIGLGRTAAASWPITEAARPALEALRDTTGESVQLYVRDGDERICLVSLESAHELRTIVAEGARLRLDAGSAGRILRGDGGPMPWVESIEERAPGVASVSAPVRIDDAVVAAVGVSGPIGRLGTDPGRCFGPPVVEAAQAIAASAPMGRGPIGDRPV